MSENMDTSLEDYALADGRASRNNAKKVRRRRREKACIFTYHRGGMR